MTDNPTVKEILIDHIQNTEEINTSQSIIDIIWDFLESNEYDGLCGEQCGCKFDDLAPGDCDGCILECRVGYKHPCVYVEGDCGCDDKEGHSWCMRLTEPEATDGNTKT